MKREQLIGTYNHVMLRSESGVELSAHIIIAECDERLYYAVTVSADTSYFTKLDRAIEFYKSCDRILQPASERDRVWD